MGGPSTLPVTVTWWRTRTSMAATVATEIILTASAVNLPGTAVGRMRYARI